MQALNYKIYIRDQDGKWKLHSAFQHYLPAVAYIKNTLLEEYGETGNYKITKGRINVWEYK